MQIRETARTWFEARSKPGGGPRVRGQALPPSQGRLPPIPLNILGKILEAMGRGRVSGRLCVNPVTQGGSTSPAAKKAGYLLCQEKGKTKGPHLILQRLSSSCLSTPPPPHSSLAREQDGSCPQEIKIPNGSISCQALSPATKVDSVPAKSPQAFSHPFVSLVRYPH